MDKVHQGKIFDTTVWLYKTDSLPFELWHQIAHFIVEKPKLKDYIIINEQVIHITPGFRSMTPIKLFKNKKMLLKMHRKTFGNKLQDSFIAFDIYEGRKTIQEVL